LDESKVEGPNGSLWTHEAIIIVPKKLTYTNVSLSYMTTGCNDVPNQKLDPLTDKNVIFGDKLAYNSETISVVIRDIPNCPLVFKNDPL
jgi:PhoPQ-activated pathogenicity-related protein